MRKELQGLEEGPETNIHMESLRAVLKKKGLNSKTPRYDGIHGFWFFKIPVYPR